MSDLEGSSVIPSNKKYNLKQKLGDQCTVCGCPGPVDGAHIIARNQSANDLLEILRSWSPQLAGFRRDQIENLLFLCPIHHREYHAGITTVVPDHETRKQLRNHEMLDFELRQQAVNQGRRDPGRQLPVESELKVNFESISLKSPHRVFVHTPTPAWAPSFIDDSKGVTQPYPIQDWALLIYPLILAAYQPLFRPSLILPPQGEVARAEVAELVYLYNRRIFRPEPPSVLTSQPFQVDLEIIDRHYPVRNTTYIQESPRDEMEATGEGLGEEPGLPTSFHTFTDGTQSQMEDESLVTVYAGWEQAETGGNCQRAKFGLHDIFVHDRVLRHTVVEYLNPIASLPNPFHVRHVGWSILSAIKFLNKKGWFL